MGLLRVAPLMNVLDLIAEAFDAKCFRRFDDFMTSQSNFPVSRGLRA